MFQAALCSPGPQTSQLSRFHRDTHGFSALISPYTIHFLRILTWLCGIISCTIISVGGMDAVVETLFGDVKRMDKRQVRSAAP